MECHSYSKPESKINSCKRIENCIPESDRLLILQVKMNKCIYERKRNKEEQEKAWIAIATTLGKTVDDCKRRWKVLREKYCKERQKANNENDLARFPIYNFMTWIEPYLYKRSHVTSNIRHLNHNIRGERSLEEDYEHEEIMPVEENLTSTSFVETSKSSSKLTDVIDDKSIWEGCVNENDSNLNLLYEEVIPSPTKEQSSQEDFIERPFSQSNSDNTNSNLNNSQEERRPMTNITLNTNNNGNTSVGKKISPEEYEILRKLISSTLKNVDSTLKQKIKIDVMNILYN